jgi:hypothetical protein
MSGSKTKPADAYRRTSARRVGAHVHTILDMSERGYSAGAGAAAHVTWATQKLRIRKGCVREPGEQRPDLHSNQGIGAGRPRSCVLQRKVRGRVPFTNSDRLFFVQLYRWFPSVLKAVTIIRPETLVRWHRAGFRRLAIWCGSRDERWSEIQIWGWRRRMMRAIKKRPPVRADAASHSAARHRHERP